MFSTLVRCLILIVAMGCANGVLLLYYFKFRHFIGHCHYIVTSMCLSFDCFEHTLSHSRETEWHDRVEDLFLFFFGFSFEKSWRNGASSNFFRACLVSKCITHHFTHNNDVSSMRTFRDATCETVSLSIDSLRGGSLAIHAPAGARKLADRALPEVLPSEISQNRSVIRRHMMNLRNLYIFRFISRAWNMRRDQCVAIYLIVRMTG